MRLYKFAVVVAMVILGFGLAQAVFSTIIPIMPVIAPPQAIGAAAAMSLLFAFWDYLGWFETSSGRST